MKSHGLTAAAAILMVAVLAIGCASGPSHLGPAPWFLSE